MLLSIVPYKNNRSNSHTAIKKINSSIRTHPLNVAEIDTAKIEKQNIKALKMTTKKIIPPTHLAIHEEIKTKNLPDSETLITRLDSVTNNVILASYKHSQNYKWVLLEEETGGGRKIRKCYKVYFKNNHWEYLLVWALTIRPTPETEVQ